MFRIAPMSLAITLCLCSATAPAYAQSVCGDAPPTIPNLDKSSREKIDTNLKGSAQSLFKAALNADLDGRVQIEKEKIFQEYKNVDQYLLKQRLLYITCTIIMKDDKMDTAGKIEQLSLISDKVLK